MRIPVFLTALLLLAACSPGGHHARRTETPAAGAPSASASAPSVPASASPGGAPAEPPAVTATPLPPVEPGGAARRVTFAVGGSVRRATVTYAVPGERKKRLVVSPPWSKTFTVADGQDFDVRAHSVADGSLSCSLKVDGELVKDASSSGGDMTVDCGDSTG